MRRRVVARISFESILSVFHALLRSSHTTCSTSIQTFFGRRKNITKHKCGFKTESSCIQSLSHVAVNFIAQGSTVPKPTMVTPPRAPCLRKEDPVCHNTSTTTYIAYHTRGEFPPVLFVTVSLLMLPWLLQAITHQSRSQSVDIAFPHPPPRHGQQHRCHRKGCGGVRNRRRRVIVTAVRQGHNNACLLTKVATWQQQRTSH